MNRGTTIDWSLRLYLFATFAFVFAPIAASFVFSFNVDRFPSLPLGGFSLTWYQQVAADPLVWEGLRNSVIVGVTVSILATALGFGFIAGMQLHVSAKIRLYMEWEYIDARSGASMNTAAAPTAWDNLYIDFSGHRILLGVMYYAM